MIATDHKLGADGACLGGRRYNVLERETGVSRAGGAYSAVEVRYRLVR